MTTSTSVRLRKSKTFRAPAAGVVTAPCIAEIAKLEHHRAEQLAQERQKRGRWHWLSFANKTGFLGGAIVWAHGNETAVLRARKLNISRGFRGTVDVFCEPIPRRVIEEHVTPDLRNRLLSEREVLDRLEGRRTADNIAGH
jgi:hypothetical protein